MADHEAWLRIYDSSPAADIDSAATYRKETSDDGGTTWEYPRKSTGQHLRLDVTAALAAGLTVDHQDDATVIESPYPMGGLIRYTPTH